MKLRELWQLSPQSHVFIVLRNKALRVTQRVEYKGGDFYADRAVARITAKAYPNYKSVLEVELK